MPQRSAHLNPVVESQVAAFLARTPMTFARLTNAALSRFLLNMGEEEQRAALRDCPRTFRQVRNLSRRRLGEVAA